MGTESNAHFANFARGGAGVPILSTWEVPLDSYLPRSVGPQDFYHLHLLLLRQLIRSHVEPSAPLPHHYLEVPMYELHAAAHDGSVQRTLAVLSRGAVEDIDPRRSERRHSSYLCIYAAGLGHSRVVRILLSKRANVANVNGTRFAALQCSAWAGHLAATERCW